jgi:glutathione S-transferase
MGELEDFIRQINRELERHHRRAEARQKATAEQRRLMARHEGRLKRYPWVRWVLAAVTVLGVLGGAVAVLLIVVGR